MVEIVAAWKLALHVLPGGYPNMLARKNTNQTAQACGTNISRLQRVKRLFDPTAFSRRPYPCHFKGPRREHPFLVLDDRR
jgi:hypothetical protein